MHLGNFTRHFTQFRRLGCVGVTLLLSSCRSPYDISVIDHPSAPSVDADVLFAVELLTTYSFNVMDVEVRVTGFATESDYRTRMNFISVTSSDDLLLQLEDENRNGLWDLHERLWVSERVDSAASRITTAGQVTVRFRDGEHVEVSWDPERGI